MQPVVPLSNDPKASFQGRLVGKESISPPMRAPLPIPNNGDTGENVTLNLFSFLPFSTD